MINSRIKFNTIVQNQFPDFVKESYPLLLDFLKQYYIAVENQGSTLDILQNIDRYVKVDLLSNLVDSTILTSDITFFADTINVQSTEGFPNTYGLIQIDDEIITYTEKTDTSFIGCVRGFSGITSYKKSNTPDNLVFEQSLAKNHNTSTSVKNLSILSLKEFLVKSPLVITVRGREFVTGDANYTVGKTIRLRFLDTNPYLDDQSAKFDLKKSGDYLIMTAKHVFSEEGVKTELMCGRVASLGVEAEL